jgi:hypothetical protein
MSKLQELADSGSVVPISIADLPEILTEALQLATDWSDEAIKSQVDEVMTKVNEAVKSLP